MIKTISTVAMIFTVLTGLNTAAFAETDEECAAVGRIAEKVMERRQGGKSLQSTMDVVIPKGNDTVGPGFRKMIMDAYEVPFFNMQESKDRAIGEFRDQWQLTCMKG
ncbi:hypothetical protein DXM27_05010 [Rhizobium rhizogenes]|uniref:Uncharacterized protein n=1 Tax=Rhizobium rhizogenes TaxID=359 RepID=A0AA88JSK9_RHIRH|nr:hypothetical protein [Rhizobium rhizogenes]KAA3504577.1 hypothetical protein DXM27_05010 [Rhizobium rhizogenes]